MYALVKVASEVVNATNRSNKPPNSKNTNMINTATKWIPSDMAPCLTGVVILFKPCKIELVTVERQ